MNKIIGIIIAVTLIFVSVVSFAESTKNEVGLKIDLGDNTRTILTQGGKEATALIDKLTTSIGEAGNKIFPYFVKQVRIQGIVNLILISLSMVLFFACSFHFFKRVFKIHDDIQQYAENDPNRALLDNELVKFGIYGAICGAIFVVSMFVGLANIPDWIANVINPEYGAIRDLQQQIQAVVK